MSNLEHSLLPAISRALQASSTPMVSAELYGLPEIQSHAPSSSGLSTYLNSLWHEGLLQRVLRQSDDMRGTTWAYTWKGECGPFAIPMPKKATVFEYLEGLKKGFQD